MMSASITNFTNNSTITSTSTDNQTFYLDNGNNAGKITHLTNTGIISGGIRILGKSADMTITNYGTMRGVWTQYQPLTITLNNLGVLQTNQGSYVTTSGNNAAHFALENDKQKIVIQNYMMILRESQNDFNNFSGYGDKTNNKNSHLIIQYNSHTPTAQNVYFKDGDSKIWLDFGDGFEIGKEYEISKLVTDRSGNSVSALNIDFSHLTTRSELYTLTKRGNNFIVNPADSKTAGYSTIGLLHKSNVKTMNSFYLQSNNVIYPKRHTKHKRTLQRRVIRKKVSSLMDSISARHFEPSLESEESMNLNNGLDSFALDSSLRASHYAQNDGLVDSWIASYSANTRNDESLALQSHETFFYDSQIYLADSQRQTRSIRTRNLNTTNPNQSTNPNTNRVIRTTQSTQNNNYYFVLTPFVAHNLFFKSGRYNLSGLEYGFITAFGGNISPSNYLGAHFAFSYGSLSDKNDKIFNITSSNMMVGLNYKFNMIWSMYLKARIDAFYFLNQVQSIAVTSGRVIKPNNLGFGASVAYGKEWDFGNGGILGLEVALDYKGLMSPSILTQNGGDANINESFSKAFYNMLYVDLGLNYDKYFDTSVGKWGLDAGLGIKANATANALAKSNIRLNNIRDINMMLDNDMVLAYLNVGGSYVLNAKDFDMEFSLAYYGNYGDRVISNGGGVEFRVNF